MRLLPLFKPRPEHRPLSTSAGRGITVRWLGTAGHVVQAEGTTLLIDPFLTRTPIHGLGRRLVSQVDRYAHFLPDRVDAVLLGHSHYDHLLDAPSIAQRTGALVVGSRTTGSFALASGLSPEQIRVVPPEGSSFRIGAFDVRFVPSLHGRILAGRVPFDGEVLSPPRLPARLWQYKMGGAFGIHLSTGGRSVYHNGSVDLKDAELSGLAADTLLLGLAGRFATRDYLGRITRALQPRLVLPTHHDQFFSPLDGGVRLLPGINLRGFARELRDALPGAQLVTPTYEDRVVVPLDGDPRDAVVLS